MDVTPNGRVLTPRPVHDTVADLLAGCTDRRPFAPADPAFGDSLRVRHDRRRAAVLKHVHLDDDFTMRVSGDLGCRPLRVWEAGLMDLAPDAIDHAVLGVARGDGRNGWGAALLLRDASTELVPPGDEPITERQHLAFLDHLAALSAAAWEWRDDRELLQPERRWAWFSDVASAGSATSAGPRTCPGSPQRGGSASPPERRRPCAS